MKHLELAHPGWLSTDNRDGCPDYRKRDACATWEEDSLPVQSGRNHFLKLLMVCFAAVSLSGSGRISAEA